MNDISREERELMAAKVYEAASLVETANTGKPRAIPHPEMYTRCGTQLALIARCISEIRAKGFGKDVEPNTYTS